MMNPKIKSGFTLIEILIVIAIISILAAIAVGSYGIARKKAKIDVVTDNLVSLLKQQQSLAKAGKSVVTTQAFVDGVGGSGGSGGSQQKMSTSFCYGMKFEKSSTIGSGSFVPIKLLRAPYVALSSNKADFCDDSRLEETAFNEFENFNITAVEKDDGEVGQFLVLFKPPFAKPIFDLAQDFDPTPELPVFKITLATADNSETRKFMYESSTGLITRL